MSLGIIFIPAGGTGGGGERGPEGPAGPKGEFNFRGAWSGATEYAKGDAVEEGGTTYASLKAANLNHKPSELGEWWGIVAAKGATGGAGANGEGLWRGIWSGVTEYAKGDIVEEAGSSYIAIKGANTNHKPSELGVWWNLVVAKGATGAEGSFANINWEAVESLNAKLGKQGAPYSENISAGLMGGIIFVAGVIKVTEEVLAKGILFILPPNCRPEKQQQVTVGDNGAAGTHNLTIKTNGEVETIAAIKTTVSPLSLNFFIRKIG